MVMPALETERVMTVEEFDTWVLLPENIGHDFEYVGGRVIEVVSNNRSSGIGHLLGSLIGVYVFQKKLGFTTGADGGYWVAGERYIPDAAYVSAARQFERTDDAYFPIAPDLAVEVLSPSNTAEEIRIKVVNYLTAGTTVWVVDADRERIEVYTPGKPVRLLRRGAILDGDEVLPGFSVAVNAVLGDKK
jgi:Uma2 family endonuclease